MSDTNGPLIVRRAVPTYFGKPGIHSHNITRRLSHSLNRGGALTGIRVLLLVLGLSGVGYYSYTVSDEYVYQAYQNWAFDQQISGRSVTFADYLRERTPFGFLVGTKTGEASAPTAAASHEPTPNEIPRPVEGAPLGRVEIPRLNLSAMVREGVDSKTLSLAVGHVPSTALPGQAGNFAIAAHRDTLFRALKDIRKDDLVNFESQSGKYTYQVMATKIVKPSDVSVLRADGGGLIPGIDNPSDKDGAPPKLLTMITCYPFYYVGSAPKRFIVEAKLQSPEVDTQNAGPPPAPSPPAASSTEPAKPVKPVLTSELRHERSSLHMRKAHAVPTTQRSATRPPKKRGFWHRVLHIS